MEEKVSYYPFIDKIKGFAIILVVMGHALAWCHADYSFLLSSFFDITDSQMRASFLWRLIYSFHMPLLFFISGFLFYNTSVNFYR